MPFENHKVKSTTSLAVYREFEGVGIGAPANTGWPGARRGSAGGAGACRGNGPRNVPGLRRRTRMKCHLI